MISRSVILKFLRLKFGGSYKFSSICYRRDCCPGEFGHHEYRLDGKSVKSTTHPHCKIIVGPHRHLEKL